MILNEIYHLQQLTALILSKKSFSFGVSRFKHDLIVAWLESPWQTIYKTIKGMLMNIALFSHMVPEEFYIRKSSLTKTCRGIFYHGTVQIINIKFGRSGWTRLTVQSCNRSIIFFFLFLLDFLHLFTPPFFISPLQKITYTTSLPCPTPADKNQWVMMVEVDMAE